MKKILNSNYTKNIVTLLTGSAISQLIMAGSLPILTRLYSPEQFSVLAMYIALLGLITSVSCLRLNIAIPMPKNNREAINLFILSIISSLVISIFSIILLRLYFSMTDNPSLLRLKDYFFLVFLGVLLTSIYNSLQYWHSRKKDFRLIAKTRVARALAGSSFQIGSGLVLSAPFGLILGHTIYTGAGIIGFFISFMKKDLSLLKEISFINLRKTFIEYKNFPIYSVPEALFNTAGAQVPILIIASMVAGPEAGFLMLSMRLLGAPIGLIGRSVSQVFISEAPTKLREGTLRNFTIKTMISLLKIGAIPLLVIGLVSPAAFPYIFGQNWAEAGWIIPWMIPWYLIQFVSSPVSVVLHVQNKIFTAMVLQIIGLAIRVIPLWLAVNHVGLADKAIIIFALSSFLYYFLYLFIVLGSLSDEKKTFT